MSSRNNCQKGDNSLVKVSTDNYYAKSLETSLSRRRNQK